MYEKGRRYWISTKIWIKIKRNSNRKWHIEGKNIRNRKLIRKSSFGRKVLFWYRKQRIGNSIIKRVVSWKRVKNNINVEREKSRKIKKRCFIKEYLNRGVLSEWFGWKK